MKGHLCILLQVAALASSATATKNFQTPSGSSYIKKEDLPVTGNEWVSLDRNIEFLAAENVPLSNFGFNPPRRNLDEDEVEQAREDNAQYRVQPFVEGVSDYDENQQAWRLLGFMIDCDDKYSDADDDEYGQGCSRYVLWAAYVDLGYENGGKGEYQYWDRKNEKWDKTACNYDANGAGSRCAKMDCHKENTHFSLLGFFKHKSYDDWMEQLFKHEGYCIWDEDEYEFMDESRETWPEGCTMSSTTDEAGDYIYYDLKPVKGGGITIGLYTDTRCVQEYQRTGKNDPISIENVVGNFLEDGSGDSGDNGGNGDDAVYTNLESSMAAWDSAFDIFKTCQPCVAYDLNNVGYTYDDDGMHGSTYNGGGDDQYNNNNGGGDDFDCYDQAGYTNVNQCMKFMAKTEMQTATFRDLAVASAQGTLVDAPLAGYRHKSRAGIGETVTYLYLSISVCILIFGIFRFHKARQQHNFAPNWSPKQPLIFA